MLRSLISGLFSAGRHFCALEFWREQEHDKGSFMDFARAQAEYLRHLAAERGLSANYRKSVRTVLVHFERWLMRSAEDEAVAQQNKPQQLTATLDSAPGGVPPVSWQQLDTAQLSKFLSSRRAEGLASSSVRLHAVILKGFFAWLSAEKELKEDPAALLHLPKLMQLLPKSLEEKSIAKLLESIEPKRPLDLRDRALLELLYSSGLRVAEIVQLPLGQVDFSEALVRVQGKGSKTRIVPVGEHALEALQRYVHKARPQLLGLRSSRACFVSVRGHALSTERVRQIIKERARSAGIEQAVWPHLLRHSYATHMLSSGADLRVIQELLGHADISTTQMYTHVDAKRLRSIHESYHPRA